MKVRKFIFKFTDHDNFRCKKIEVELLSNTASQWNENLDDIAGNIEWAVKYKQWEHKLKKQIEQVVADAHFNGNLFDQLGYRLDCKYREKKKKVKNLNKKPGRDVTLKVEFLMVKNVWKFEKEHRAGKKARDWDRVYTKDYTKHVFVLKSNELEEFSLEQVCEPIALEEDVLRYDQKPSQKASKQQTQTPLTDFLATSNSATLNKSKQSVQPVKPSQVQNQQSVKQSVQQLLQNLSQTPGQTGGDDEYRDKYMKYKKRYLELKEKNGY